MTEIVDLMVERLRDQLEAQGLGIELNKAAKNLVVEKGYDPAAGCPATEASARADGRSRLSEMILSKEFRAGDTVIVDAENAEIILRIMGQPELPEAERPAPTVGIRVSPWLKRKVVLVARSSSVGGG